MAALVTRLGVATDAEDFLAVPAFLADAEDLPLLAADAPDFFTEPTEVFFSFLPDDGFFAGEEALDFFTVAAGDSVLFLGVDGGVAIGDDFPAADTLRFLVTGVSTLSLAFFLAAELGLLVDYLPDDFLPVPEVIFSLLTRAAFLLLPVLIYPVACFEPDGFFFAAGVAATFLVALPFALAAAAVGFFLALPFAVFFAELFFYTVLPVELLLLLTPLFKSESES